MVGLFGLSEASFDDTNSWYDVETLFQKYDKTNSKRLYIHEVAEAFRDAGLVFDDNDLTSIMDEQEWSSSKVSLLRFQYLFERFRSEGDPEAVDEMSTKSRKGTLAAWVRMTDRRKEAGRRSRRTVFVESDWRKFRSSYRIIDNLSTFFGKSSVVRAVWLEVLLVFLTASTVFVGNSLLAAGTVDALFPAEWNVHLTPVDLPGFPFFLTSGALGLLLIFRTDWAYSRYRDARVLWGDVVDMCRTMFVEGDLALDDAEDL
eukprot:CAMPEP_0181343900 /NCGR_PEP_ID=MMETSP1101-20121128/31861_1 /TAXON_ID=46948 /ORGANISM="Rhodomonas abbreviata, Strain Caron Lab Isolate" /LENGTH=258 /DNA_ID=CAMNT_0023455617 /DNA_START=44 /DNA_END=817 /DNA_ORIENTATION=+